MKFTVDSKAFLKEVQLINTIVNNNPVLPILADVLLTLKGNNLSLRSSDLEINLSSILTVDGKDDGEICVNAKMLKDTLAALPQQPIIFSANLESFKIDIKAETGEYSFVGEDSEDFPDLIDVQYTQNLSIDSKVLGRAFDMTNFATSTDELRPAMTGVLIESEDNKLNFVATDAHKLSKHVKSFDTAFKSPINVIVPRKAVNALNASLNGFVGDVDVQVSDRNIIFNVGGVEIAARLVAARYPNYNSVIPENNKVMTVNRIDLLNSVKRLSIFSNKTTYQLSLEVKNNSLKVSSKDLDFNNEGIEDLIVEYSSEPIHIAFNAKYLLELLTALDCESIDFRFSTPQKAGIIEPSLSDESEKTLMLAMPIMITDEA